jgi:hypothetical protein
MFKISSYVCKFQANEDAVEIYTIFFNNTQFLFVLHNALINSFKTKNP